MCRYCRHAEHANAYSSPSFRDLSPLARELRFRAFMGMEDEVIIPNNTSKEPALKIGGTVGTVYGILSLILYISPAALSERQVNIVLIIAAFILPIFTAILTRGNVWSPKTVQEVLDTAVEDAKKQIPKRPLPPTAG